MSEPSAPAAEITAKVELERPTLEAGGPLRGRVVLGAAQRCRCVELRLALRWSAWGLSRQLSRPHDAVDRGTVAAEASWPTEIEELVVAEYVLEQGRWSCRIGAGPLDGEPDQALDLVDAHPYRDGADQGAVAPDGALELGPRDLALRFALRAPSGPASYWGQRLRVTWRLEAHVRTDRGRSAEATCPFDLAPGPAGPYCHGTASEATAVPAPFRGGHARRGWLVLAIALGLPLVGAPALLGAPGLWVGAAFVCVGLVVLLLALRARRQHALLSVARARPAADARAGEPVDVCVQAPVALPVRGFTIALEQVERLPDGSGPTEHRRAVARAEVPHQRLEIGDALTESSTMAAHDAASRRRLARGGWLLTARVGLPPGLPPSFHGRACALDWQLRVALHCGVRPDPWTLVPLLVAPGHRRQAAAGSDQPIAWGGVGGTTASPAGGRSATARASSGDGNVVDLVPVDAEEGASGNRGTAR